jgi:lipopolysaccharide biosynthesis glycosyltransferase
MKIDVALSVDDNYAKYCATAMCSILDNKNEDDEIFFHLLHGDILDENITTLALFPNTKLYKLNESEFSPYVRREMYIGFTPMFYRLKLASILKNIEKVIYLDCDIIVLKSLSELYSVDISNYVIAAQPAVLADPAKTFSFYKSQMDRLGLQVLNEGFYFNSGVIYMNLEKIRNEKIEKDFFKYLKENSQEIQFADQDTLNVVLQGKCLALDSKFNFVPNPKYHNNEFCKTLPTDIAILHFAGAKPWDKGFYNPFTEEFWGYYKKSGFVTEQEFLEQYDNYKKSRTKIAQIILYLSRYPFAIFRPSKIKNLFEIFFS